MFVMMKLEHSLNIYFSESILPWEETVKKVLQWCWEITIWLFGGVQSFFLGDSTKGRELEVGKDESERGTDNWEICECVTVHYINKSNCTVVNLFVFCYNSYNKSQINSHGINKMKCLVLVLCCHNVLTVKRKFKKLNIFAKELQVMTKEVQST